MKICTITNPTSIHSYRWIKYFADQGHELHLIYFEGIYTPLGKVDLGLKNVTAHKVRYFSNFLRVLQLPFELLQLFRIMNKIKPDILDAKYISTRGWYGALLAFHPYIINVWGSDIDRDPEVSARARFKVKFALKKVDYVRTGSKNSMKQLIKFGCTKDKIILLPELGVDTKMFSPKARSNKLRARFSARDSPLIICLRHFKPNYDLETFFKAIPEILKKFPDAKFIQAGEGPLEPVLKKLAKDLGIDDAVYFVGHIPHDEVAKYLASSDVYVDPFFPVGTGGGGPGQGIREALSVGIPTVNGGPNPAKAMAIDDGQNGLFFEGGNPKDLAKKVIFLLENPEIGKKFGVKSRAIIKERYRFSMIMGLLEKKYRDIVADFAKVKK